MQVFIYKTSLKSQKFTWTLASVYISFAKLKKKSWFFPVLFKKLNDIFMILHDFSCFIQDLEGCFILCYQKNIYVLWFWWFWWVFQDFSRFFKIFQVLFKILNDFLLYFIHKVFMFYQWFWWFFQDFSRFFKIFQDFSRFFMFHSRSWMISYCILFKKYSCFINDFFKIFHEFSRFHMIFKFFFYILFIYHHFTMI